MGRRIILGQTRTATQVQGYIGFWPCMQADTDTDVKDRSGKGNNLAFNLLTTGEAWATPNRLSKPTTASHHPTLPKSRLSAAWQWNATRRDSLLISARMKITLTGGSQYLMGNCNGATEGGIKFVVSSSGAWQMGFYDKLLSVSQFSSSSAVDVSWGSNYHSLTLLLDGPNNSFSRYVDGVLLDGPIAFTTLGTLEPQSTTFDFVFGGNQPTTAGVACSMYAMHMLAAPQFSGSPRRPDELARRLHLSPLTLVSAAEWPY